MVDDPPDPLSIPLDGVPPADAPPTAPEVRVSDATLTRVLDLVRNVTAKLHYLKYSGGKFEAEASSMVRIRLRSERTAFPREDIQADLRTLWGTDICGDRDPSYWIKDTIRGFEFHFTLLMPSGELVTGVITVDLPDSHVVVFRG